MPTQPITAMELRIGNFVNHNNIVHEVTSLSVNLVTLKDDRFTAFGSDYKYLSGIPLTTEWLERFGFESCSSGGWKIDGLHLGVDNDYERREVLYVHALQNLYFCLTGNELEIKS